MGRFEEIDKDFQEQIAVEKEMPKMMRISSELEERSRSFISLSDEESVEVIKWVKSLELNSDIDLCSRELELNRKSNEKLSSQVENAVEAKSVKNSEEKQTKVPEKELLNVLEETKQQKVDSLIEKEIIPVESALIQAPRKKILCFEWDNPVSNNDYIPASWGHKIHVNWMMKWAIEKLKQLRHRVIF